MPRIRSGVHRGIELGGLQPHGQPNLRYQIQTGYREVSIRHGVYRGAMCVSMHGGMHACLQRVEVQ